MQSMDNRVESNAEVMGAQYFRLVMTDDWDGTIARGQEFSVELVESVDPVVDLATEDILMAVFFPLMMPNEVIEVAPIVVESEPTPIIIESVPVVEMAELPIIPAPSIPPIEIIDSTPVEEVRPPIQAAPELEPDPVLDPIQPPAHASWYSRLWVILNTDILVLAKRAYSWWVSH